MIQTSRTSLFIKEDVTRDHGIPDDGWTSDDISETIRRTLTPSGLSTYLPIGQNYTTPPLLANTPTKVVIPVTVKFARDFAIAAGGGEQFTRDTTTIFELYSSTTMTTNTNNVVGKFYMYNNGVYVPGCAIQRKVGTGADVGTICRG